MWQKLVGELLSVEGMTEQKIAQLVGTSQPTIHRLRKGATREPSYSLGRALERLHESHFGEAPEASPVPAG